MAVDGGISFARSKRSLLGRASRAHKSTCLACQADYNHEKRYATGQKNKRSISVVYAGKNYELHMGYIHL